MTDDDQIWQRRIRLGPLLVGVVVSLSISLAVVALTPGAAATTDPSADLISAAWGLGLIAAVLGIRIKVLDERHLLPAALGFTVSTVLILLSEGYLSALSAATTGATAGPSGLDAPGMGDAVAALLRGGLPELSAAQLGVLASSPLRDTVLQGMAGGAGTAATGAVADLPALAQLATGVELALLAIAAPGLIVLSGLLGRTAMWVGIGGVGVAALALQQTVQPTLDPASVPVLAGLLIGIMLLLLTAALLWLRRAGRGPGDAEGWVGTTLVVFAGLAAVGAHDALSGDGAVLSTIGMAMAAALMGGGLMYSFAVTLNHRQDIERTLRRRIGEALIMGFDTPEVDAAHILAVDRVLTEGTLTTVLQPVVDLTDGAVLGYESLARFDGISPDQAFAAASAVGRSVALELLAAAAPMDRLSQIPDAHLAINMGPDAITDPSFLALVESCGTADRIVVELTEHQQVGNRDVVLQAFERLRAAGARIALDDVGAGFAGLKLLAELSPDVVKLDRAIVTGCCEDPVSVAIIEGLVTFARRTGTVLIAEGVEDARTATLLRELGVGQGQGWHFGRPGQPVVFSALPSMSPAQG